MFLVYQLGNMLSKLEFDPSKIDWAMLVDKQKLIHLYVILKTLNAFFSQPGF